MKYQKQALRTNTPKYSKVIKRVSKKDKIDILHAAIGIGTEAGEVQDAVKRYLFYGTKLDKENLIEEMGDIFWYVALLANSLNVSFEEVMRRNLNKLERRYPKGFTETRALNRLDVKTP